MDDNRTNLSLLSQIIKLFPREPFRKLVNDHGTERYSKKFTSWSHLVSMLFCHLGQCGGVRDVQNGLQSTTGDLNHLGVTHAPDKSSLSYMNKTRSWELFRDYFQELLKTYSSSFKNKKIPGLNLRRKVYALDSTLVSLCLELFDWAQYRKQKGAIKIHSMLDYDGFLPVYARVTDGKTSDIEVAREIDVPPGSVIVADRAYVDFSWFDDLDSKGVVFVTRAKSNLDCDIVQEYDTSEEEGHILEDVDIRLFGQQTASKYPKKLRRVTVVDPDTGQLLEFLTNERRWKASTVSRLYKKRWEIEVFFKLLKQNLKIKSFVGTSFNAVMIQIWTAMITTLVIKYLQEKAKYKWHLSNLVQFIRLHMFSRIDLFKWLDEPFIKRKRTDPGTLSLF